MMDLETDERVKGLLRSPTRPDIEAIRPLLKDYQIDNPDKLWRFLEKLTHLWADSKSTEGE